jgi:hypothetical protein
VYCWIVAIPRPAKIIRSDFFGILHARRALKFSRWISLALQSPLACCSHELWAYRDAIAFAFFDVGLEPRPGKVANQNDPIADRRRGRDCAMSKVIGTFEPLGAQTESFDASLRLGETAGDSEKCKDCGSRISEPPKLRKSNEEGTDLRRGRRRRGGRLF